MRLLLRLREYPCPLREDCAGPPVIRGDLLFGGRLEWGEPARVPGEESAEIADEDRPVAGDQDAALTRRHLALLHPPHPVHPEGGAVPAGGDDDESLRGMQGAVREAEEHPGGVDGNGPAVQVHAACRSRMPSGIGRERHHARDLADRGERDGAGHPRDGEGEEVRAVHDWLRVGARTDKRLRGSERREVDAPVRGGDGDRRAPVAERARDPRA